MSDLRLAQAELHRQLLAIRAERELLEPQEVVDAARPADHPLHPRFEWDNSIAGEAYRRIQASELIRSVQLVYAETPEGEERRVRAWAALPAKPGRSGYQPTEEIVRDEFSAKLLLRQAERELKAFQRKYGHLKEFADLIAKALTEVAS